MRVSGIFLQYGCGGRELAGILAEKLKVKLFDRQLVHIAAAKLSIDDLPESELIELENTVTPLSMTFIPFHSFGVKLGSGEYSRGIILGRCADYVLRDHPNKISIFVTAADEYRGKTFRELNAENSSRGF